MSPLYWKQNPRCTSRWWWVGIGDFRYMGQTFSSYREELSSKLLFSRSVVSDSLQPHGLQLIRLPCPSPSPRACSNSCPLSRQHYPTISSSVILCSSCPQSFPASGSFPVSQLFTSGGQSIGASASAWTLPMNIQGWFPLGSHAQSKKANCMGGQ